MLTDAKARKIRSGHKAIHVGGVKGLYLRPSAKNGAGKFVFRFVSPESKKRRDMGFGSYPNVKIAEARQKAFLAHELIAQGIDPLEQQKRLETRERFKKSIPTFEDAALQVHEDISLGFRNRKHINQWINTLRTYAFPQIGSVPVDELLPVNFSNLLKKIWLEKPETASRVRQRCERVMMWCIAQEFISNNPVSAVTALLPKQKKKRDRVQHFPSVPWRHMPNIFQNLFATSRLSCGKQALLFLILTASRSGEVRGATWNEINFIDKIWTIPPNRMKTNREHRKRCSAPT